jgi:hypothetical protein
MVHSTKIGENTVVREEFGIKEPRCALILIETWQVRC